MERRDEIRIGLLFSSTGPYATIARTMLNGARLAIDEVNADPAFPFTLAAATADPGGRNAEYAAAAQHFLARRAAGPRRRLLHLVEPQGGAAAVREVRRAALVSVALRGLREQRERRLHGCGAEPAHRAAGRAPAAPPRHARAYCVGSNYIWAWENNKIMREAVQAAGGQVLAERYFPVGETDFAAVIGQILDAAPSFVFNTLIGVSAYAFFRAFRAAALAGASTSRAPCRSRAAAWPSPSWSRSGPRPAPATSARSVYFESIDTPANRAFVAAYRRRFPEAGPTSADVEVLLRGGPPARPGDPAGRHAGDGRGQGRPAPRRHGGAAGPRAGRRRQPPLLPHAAHRRLDRGGRLRGHLRGARPGAARPVLRLARVSHGGAAPPA